MKFAYMVVVLAFLLTFDSFASPINQTSTPNPCDIWDVQVTKVRPVGSETWFNFDPTIGALSCIGALAGNNSSFYNPETGEFGDYNLGYKNDGWMNFYGDKTSFWDTDGAFITDPSMLQDLQGLGQIDPGWIQMGKDDGNGFVPDSSSKMTSDGLKTYTYEQTVFSMDNCKDKGGANAVCVGGDAVSGNWLFSPPATSPEALFDILGGTFFDQMALVFKSGTAFAMYTFSISQFGLDPILPGDQKFEFAGTWDMSSTLINKGGQPAGLSNVSLYGRDPSGGVPIPVPATLSLLGISLLLMRLLRRKAIN